MKMNKKSILSLSALSLVALPIATLACGTDAVSKEVWFVTDGGSVNDKSFNEQGKEALQEIKGVTDVNSIIANSEGHTAADIVAGYQTAAGAGAKYILAPGFYHDDAINTWNTQHGLDALKFIIADASSAGRTNVAGILYDTQQSSFLAGVMSGLYLKAIGDTTPKVGTWGGGAFPGVTDFMTGYVNGVNYYNTTVKASADPKVTFAVMGTDTAYTDSGFAPGGGTIKATILLADGADIILPVAGPQASDAVKAVKTDNKMIIGVDSDQSLAYPSDEARILTSVLKNVKDALINIYKKIKGDETVDASYKGLGEDTKGTLENGLTGLSELNTTVKAVDGLTTIYADSTTDAIKAAAKTASEDSAINTWAAALSLLKTM